jgi:hypothetical protein
MSRHPSSSFHSLHGCVIVIACAATMVVASPAHAGIGDMVRKAKDKATQATEQKTAKPKTEAATPESDGEVQFDDVVLELTADRIDHIVATCKAAGDVAAGRPALVDKLNKATEEHNAFSEKHWPAIQEQRNKRDEVESCYHDGYRAAQDRKSEEYQKKALTDPAIREKFTRAAAEHNAAAARGDSTAIQRLQAVLAEEIMLSKEDSAAVRRKCAPMPPRLPAEDQMDAMEKSIASIEASIREIDEKIAAAQAKTGGLTRSQWAMAMERIQLFLSHSSDSSWKPPASQYSPAEAEAIGKNSRALKACFGS